MIPVRRLRGRRVEELLEEIQGLVSRRMSLGGNLRRIWRKGGYERMLSRMTENSRVIAFLRRQGQLGEMGEKIAVFGAWSFVGIFYGLGLMAAGAPGHAVLIKYNDHGELWADLFSLSLVFSMFTWYAFRRRRQVNRRVAELEARIHELEG